MKEISLTFRLVSVAGGAGAGRLVVGALQAHRIRMLLFLHDAQRDR